GRLGGPPLLLTVVDASGDRLSGAGDDCGAGDGTEEAWTAGADDHRGAPSWSVGRCSLKMSLDRDPVSAASAAASDAWRAVTSIRPPATISPPASATALATGPAQVFSHTTSPAVVPGSRAAATSSMSSV